VEDDVTHESRPSMVSPSASDVMMMRRALLQTTVQTIRMRLDRDH
jgi:hypothetical protein